MHPVSADFPSRWFDFESILSETFVRQVDFQRECRSTNDRALGVVSSLLPLLVATDAQTAGRGRGSNNWWAGDGALTFSLRLAPARFGISQEQWPLVSLATALAVSDTISLFAPDIPVGLKWPNDVHLAGRKVSGILVEPPPGQKTVLVIGIGINVLNSLASAPPEIQKIATSLTDEVEQLVSPGDVLIALLQQLEHGLSDLAASRLPLRERWASQCILTGRSITLTSGDRHQTGICRGIESSGALLIETDGVVRPCYGGTVRLTENC